jgi:hypothetical protein
MRKNTIYVLITAMIGLLIFAGSCSADTIRPVGMSNGAVGGAALNQYTLGVRSSGVNNIGLLVRTWGRVAYVDTDSQYFYIDDGAGTNDFTGFGLGVRVAYDNLAVGNTITAPTTGQYVTVTGISSTAYDPVMSRLAVVRPRRQTDITIVQ